jgi:hypothetical protein
MRDDNTIAYSAKSESQRKQYHKRKAAESRARKKEADALAEGANCQSEKEWFDLNRSKLTPAQLAEMQELHERALDQIHFVRTAQKTDEHFEDDVQDFIDFVREHPCPHLGAGYVADETIQPDWRTGFYHGGAQFYHDASLLKRLYAEGPATERFVKYGYLSGVPDWIVIRFLAGEDEHGLPKVDAQGYPTPDFKPWSFDAIAALLGMKQNEHTGEWRYKNKP